MDITTLFACTVEFLAGLDCQMYVNEKRRYFNLTCTCCFMIAFGSNSRCPTNLVINDHLVPFNHSGMCYEFITDHKHDWPHAKEDCSLKGGSLVEIDDIIEENFIMSTLRALSFSGDGLWIGLSDQDTEGQFVWTNGKPARFVYWGNNQGPTGGFFHFSRDVEDCVALRYSDSGHWHDYRCNTIGLLFDTFGWICQYPMLATTTPVETTAPSNLTGIVIG